MVINLSTNLSEDERRTILGLYYQNKSMRKIRENVHRSLSTIQRIIQQHIERVREHGLILTLSEERLVEPIELAKLYGELEETGISVDDCRSAIPIVQHCRTLQLEPERVSELIDAAVRIGSPNFPR